MRWPHFHSFILYVSHLNKVYRTTSVSGDKFSISTNAETGPWVGSWGLDNDQAIFKDRAFSGYNEPVDTRARNDNNYTHWELTIMASGVYFKG